MITKAQVVQLLEEGLQGSSIFPVTIDVSGNNDIRVLIDNDNGIGIDDCVKVSRLLEGSFDREVEDFSLNVSSPGLDQPLMVFRQYKKNVGRAVDVRRKDAGKLEGLMESATEEAIVVVTREKKRIEGRKAKEWIEEKHVIPFEEIESTRVVISFK